MEGTKHLWEAVRPYLVEEAQVGVKGVVPVEGTVEETVVVAVAEGLEEGALKQTIDSNLFLAHHRTREQKFTKPQALTEPYQRSYSRRYMVQRRYICSTTCGRARIQRSNKDVWARSLLK